MAPKGFQQDMPRDDDLYAQIAAGDEIESHGGKTTPSFVMTLMIAYMRLTLLIDAKRREYQKFFRGLRMVWAGAMGVLYLCGLVMFLILVGAYARFPSYVKDYLDKNGIACSKVDIPGYIVSQIDLYGLHDKDNQYRIEKVSLSSTFADFLNHRAKKMVIKGVNLFFDTEKDVDQNLISRFVQIGKATEKLTGAQVDSIDISDVVLTVKGKDYDIPVMMSVIGSYGKQTDMSAVVSINGQLLRANGVLLIRNSTSGMSWSFDIQEGSLSFPEQPPESLKGKVSLETGGVNVQKISADLTLQFEQIRKNITLNAERKKDLYAGNLGIIWMDLTNPFKPEERTGISFGFKGLSATLKGEIQTQEPIQLNLTTKYASDVKVEGLSTELKGKLTCQLFDNCHYELLQRSSLEASLLSFPIQQGIVQNSLPVRMDMGEAKDAIKLSFEKGKLVYDFPVFKPFYRGKLIDSKGMVFLSATKGRLSGEFDLWKKDLSLGVSLSAIEYQTPSIEIKSGLVSIDDLFSENGNFRLKSQKVFVRDNNRLKVPFSLDYIRKNNLSNILLITDDEQIQLLFKGFLNLSSGQVDGQVVVPAIDLKKVKQPLNQISDILPGSFESIYGTLSAYGRISGNIFSEINGPIYLGLDNIDIKTEGLDLKGLNSALLLRTVIPFSTEPNQHIFIKQVNSFLPIANTDMVVQIGEQFAQLKSLSADIAGISLNAEESVIPYEGVRTLVYLRNQDTNLDKAAQSIRLKNWKILDKLAGNVLLPIEIKDATLNLKNALLQLTNATLVYNGNEQNKPKYLGNDTQVDLRSGSISLDSVQEGSGDKVKFSVALDTVLKPSGVKKNFRETFTKNLTDIVFFVPSEGRKAIPTDIRDMIQKIKEQARVFRLDK